MSEKYFVPVVCVRRKKKAPLDGGKAPIKKFCRHYEVHRIATIASDPQEAAELAVEELSRESYVKKGDQIASLTLYPSEPRPLADERVFLHCAWSAVPGDGGDYFAVRTLACATSPEMARWNAEEFHTSLRLPPFESSSVIDMGRRPAVYIGKANQVESVLHFKSVCLDGLAQKLLNNKTIAQQIGSCNRLRFAKLATSMAAREFLQQTDWGKEHLPQFTSIWLRKFFTGHSTMTVGAGIAHNSHEQVELGKRFDCVKGDLGAALREIS